MRNILSFKAFEEFNSQLTKINLFEKKDWNEFQNLLDSEKKKGIKFKWDISKKVVWDRLLNENKCFLLKETEHSDKDYRFIGTLLDKDLVHVKTKTGAISYFNNNHYCNIPILYTYWPYFDALKVLNKKGFSGNLEKIDNDINSNLFICLDSLYKILEDEILGSKIMSVLGMTKKELVIKVSDFFKSLSKREKAFSELAEKSPNFFKFMQSNLDEDDFFKVNLNKDMGDLGF